MDSRNTPALLSLNSARLRTGAEQEIIVTLDWRDDLYDRIARDPALAEDCASLAESAPFLIRWREGTDPITCECCGTLVAMIPEACTGDAPPRTWTAGHLGVRDRAEAHAQALQLAAESGAGGIGR